MSIVESSIKTRLAYIQEQICSAVQSAGRTLDEIKLIAVSKYYSIEAMLEIFKYGQTYFGESYVQEAMTKQVQLTGIPIQWHFIGRVQTNKAKNIAGCFEYIHTIDSLKLAEVLSRRLSVGLPKQKILIQVNIGNEAQKAGVAIQDIQRLSEAILSLPNLQLCGLMCLPPNVDKSASSRPYFVKLRTLRDTLEYSLGIKLPELSMGMSNDFIQAIEEGSTLIRIGTGIFGERPTKVK